MSSERIEQLTRMTRRPSHPGELVADLPEDMAVTQEELAKRRGLRFIAPHRGFGYEGEIDSQKPHHGAPAPSEEN